MLFFDLINSYFRLENWVEIPIFMRLQEDACEKADGQFVDNKSQMITVSISYINKLFDYCSKC